MGFVLLSTSFGPLFNSMGIPVPLNFFIISIPGYLIFLYVQKYITTPRLGLIKFGTRRKSRQKKLIIGNVFAVLITLTCVILTLTGNLNASINKYIWILFMGLISFVIPLGILSYFMEFYRMFIYAILILLTWIFKEAINLRSEAGWLITFGMCGIIFIIIGSVLFIRFLKKYPLQPKEISES